MAPAPQLLGPDGLPIARQALAQPQLGGVRNIFSEFVVPGMTARAITDEEVSKGAAVRQAL